MPDNVRNADSTGSYPNLVVQFNPVSQLPINLIGSHNFSTWKAQDQLIQNVIMASVDPPIASTMAAASTAQFAWDSLHLAYANKSQT
ncbi:hypothetical protein KY284_001259 [Solanum tuberosum]|nr:hypothetical protein KY284_001259 [Solanum tuberosum]